MWRELIAALDPDVGFHSPATAHQTEALVGILSIALPQEMVALLQETNGAEVAHGLRLFWSTDDLASRNLEMRREWRPGGWLGHCMPVDHLLFFGEAGNGDMYAFPISANGIGPGVFLWDHEDDSRTAQAPTLESWLRGPVVSG